MAKCKVCEGTIFVIEGTPKMRRCISCNHVQPYEKHHSSKQTVIMKNPVQQLSLFDYMGGDSE